MAAGGCLGHGLLVNNYGLNFRQGCPVEAAFGTAFGFRSYRCRNDTYYTSSLRLHMTSISQMVQNRSSVCT